MVANTNIQTRTQTRALSRFRHQVVGIHHFTPLVPHPAATQQCDSFGAAFQNPKLSSFWGEVMQSRIVVKGLNVCRAMGRKCFLGVGYCAGAGARACKHVDGGCAT